MEKLAYHEEISQLSATLTRTVQMQIAEASSGGCYHLITLKRRIGNSGGLGRRGPGAQKCGCKATVVGSIPTRGDEIFT